jgi:hypothetical protein
LRRKFGTVRQLLEVSHPVPIDKVVIVSKITGIAAVKPAVPDHLWILNIIFIITVKAVKSIN